MALASSAVFQTLLFLVRMETLNWEAEAQDVSEAHINVLSVCESVLEPYYLVISTPVWEPCQSS